MIGISFQVSLALAAVPYLDPAEAKGKPQDLAKAIGSLRHIDERTLTEAEKTKKGVEMQAAWAALVGAGQRGALALKREIEAVDKAGEKDDFFKLGAAALLWQIGKLDEAGAIAKVWGATPLDAQYNYVFYTAFEAAQTQDPRALPMLSACLRDRKGSVFLEQHMLDVKWPLTHAFLWGAFGPKGLPALHEVLANSTDQVERLSALCILGRAQYLPALPTIRKLAADKDDGVRRTAIQMLGFFGHPQDYGFLVSGLNSKDPKEAHPHAFALLEYEDLRAVEHLIPLLKSDDQTLRYEVLGALRHLLTPAALEAMHAHAATARADREKKAISNSVADILKEMGLTWEAYAAKPPAEKAALLAGVRQKEEEPYKLKADDRQLTRAQLLEAAKEWRQRRSLRGGDSYAWVHDRHILAVATAEDLDLLLDVQAFVYRRLSDECLYEVDTLDKLVRRLGRSRYRTSVGICDKVEPKAP